MGELLITSLSGTSGRQAVVEESSASVWLYMSGPEGQAPIADCFLFNTEGQWAADGHDPPPLEPSHASEYQVALPVGEDDVQIIWAPGGEAVAVRVHGEYVGFIGPEDFHGYSRSVREDCDWGHPFDAELFHRYFIDGE